MYIQFKFTKTGGAQYFSHLDLLRHITRTLRRADIPIKYSEGYNKHIKIFLSPPLPLGISSLAEYCALENSLAPDEFKDRFNQFAPLGVACLSAQTAAENPNFAGKITSAEYEVEGIKSFDKQQVLAKKSIIITDFKQKQQEIRHKILNLEVFENKVICHLKSGQENLRADLFAKYLAQKFGGDEINILKTKAYTLGGGLF